MSSNETITKYKYNDKPSNPVLLKEYIIFENEQGEKFILFEFFNNYKKLLFSIHYEIDIIDKDGNICETITYKYDSLTCKKKKPFVPYNKIFVSDKCDGIQARLISCEFEGRKYENGSFIAVANTKKTHKKKQRKFTRIKNITKSQRFRFPLLGVITLAFASLIAFNTAYDLIKKINEKGTFNLDGVTYEICEKGKSVNIIKIEDSFFKTEKTLVNNKSNNTKNEKEEYENHKTLMIPSYADKFRIKGIKSDALTSYQKSDLNEIIIKSIDFKIDNEVFKDCKLLTNVDAEKCILSLGDKAFANCISLTNVSFTELGDVGSFPFSNTLYEKYNGITTLKCGKLSDNSLNCFDDLKTIEYRDTTATRFDDIFGKIPNNLSSITTSQTTIQNNFFKSVSSSTKLVLTKNEVTEKDPYVELRALEKFKGYDNNNNYESFNGKITGFFNPKVCTIGTTEIFNSIFDRCDVLEELTLKVDIKLHDIYQGRIKVLNIDTKLSDNSIGEGLIIEKLENNYDSNNTIINNAEITTIILNKNLSKDSVNNSKNLCRVVVNNSSIIITPEYNISTLEINYKLNKIITKRNEKIKTIIFKNDVTLEKDTFANVPMVENLIFADFSPTVGVDSLKNCNALKYIYTPKNISFSVAGLHKNVRLITPIGGKNESFVEVITDKYDENKTYNIYYNDEEFIYKNFICSGLQSFLRVDNKTAFYAGSRLITSYFGNSKIMAKLAKQIKVTIKEEPVVVYTDGKDILKYETDYKFNEANVYTPSKKDNLVFAGWTLDGQIFDFNNKITQDTILTAKWVKAESMLAGYNTSIRLYSNNVTLEAIITSNATIYCSNSNASFNINGQQSNGGKIKLHLKAGDKFDFKIENIDIGDQLSIVYDENIPKINIEAKYTKHDIYVGDVLNLEVSGKQDNFIGYGNNGIIYIDKNGNGIVPIEESIELSQMYE